MKRFFVFAAAFGSLVSSCTTSTPTTAAPPTVDRPFLVEHREMNPDGVPYFVRGELGTSGAITDLASVDAALGPALPRLAAMFELPADELVATRVDKDRLGMTHVLYAQTAHGMPVVGGELVVHIEKDGTISAVSSTARDASLAPTTPSITASAATETARLATANGDVDTDTPTLGYIITSGDGTLHLAWEVPVAGRHELLRDKVYVDAQTGAVVDRHPEVFPARSRTVYDGHGGTVPYASSTQVGTENSPPTEMVALAAFDNTGATYDCYHDLFQRDSWDDAGGALNSTVHVVFQTQNGTTGDNAAWALGQMWYGDGDGNFMGPTALGFDVTAHELTHGVTSATAQLAYQNESGALNEGMSDIMGAVCEAHKLGGVTARTWLVGEDIYTPNTPGDALRYMADPTADASLYPPDIGGSRDFYADRYTGTQDQGGVHLNSGIANLAFELLTVGGVHPHQKTTFNVPGIGIDKSGAIFERALTHGYFTMNTNFAQARTATEQAARDLYPGTTTSTAVSLAWAAVGVGAPPSDTTPPTVHITSPANNATVDPGFEIDVDATDDQAVSKVEIAIDGTKVATLTASPYTFTTDASIAAGSHTITATAYDSVNSAQDSVMVIVAAACPATCPAGQTCQDGTCQPDPNGSNGSNGSNADNGGNTGGCGCSSSPDGRGTAGFLFLLVGTVVLLRRRARLAHTLR